MPWGQCYLHWDGFCSLRIWSVTWVCRYHCKSIEKWRPNRCVPWPVTHKPFWLLWWRHYGTGIKLYFKGWTRLASSPLHLHTCNDAGSYRALARHSAAKQVLHYMGEAKEQEGSPLVCGMLRRSCERGLFLPWNIETNVEYSWECFFMYMLVNILLPGWSRMQDVIRFSFHRRRSGCGIRCRKHY